MSESTYNYEVTVKLRIRDLEDENESPLSETDQMDLVSTLLNDELNDANWFDEGVNFYVEVQDLDIVPVSK